ncbi:MAG: hypothetical protein AB1861_19805 [Cyanobacteriota bacterium]
MRNAEIGTTKSGNQSDRQKRLKELKNYLDGTCFKCRQPVEIPGTEGFLCFRQACGSQR